MLLFGRGMYQVILWNMDTLVKEYTPEEHKLVISDVRFRPNSSQLATASCDKSVRLWDAANVTLHISQFKICNLDSIASSSRVCNYINTLYNLLCFSLSYIAANLLCSRV